MREGAVPVNEQIARFIFSRSHFSIENKRIRPNVFMPTEDNETSVSRIDGLPEMDIWRMGQAVGVQSNRNVHARGDIRVSEVNQNKLEVFRDEPPERHAVIAGWPSDRDARMDIAIEIAKRSMLKAITVR